MDSQDIRKVDAGFLIHRWIGVKEGEQYGSSNLSSVENVCEKAKAGFYSIRKTSG
jgi:hypothetical protein